jgi:hypothetical protein
MAKPIPDFSDQQLSDIQALINARYGEETELHLGDSEIQIDPKQQQLDICPIIFWSARECNFVIMRTGEDQYRAQYFYTPHTQVSTQQAFFTTVEDCASAVLREQSDYEREPEGVTHGATSVDLH